MTARVSGVARPVGRFSELPLDEDHAPRTIREFDQANTVVGGYGAPPRAAVPTYARETHGRCGPSNFVDMHGETPVLQTILRGLQAFDWLRSASTTSGPNATRVLVSVWYFSRNAFCSV